MEGGLLEETKICQRPPRRRTFMSPPPPPPKLLKVHFHLKGESYRKQRSSRSRLLSCPLPPDLYRVEAWNPLRLRALCVVCPHHHIITHTFWWEKRGGGKRTERDNGKKVGHEEIAAKAWMEVEEGRGGGKRLSIDHCGLLRANNACRRRCRRRSRRHRRRPPPISVVALMMISRPDITFLSSGCTTVFLAFFKYPPLLQSTCGIFQTGKIHSDL